MNKRIKELYKQAGIRNRINDPGEIWGYEYNIEEFVKLIVQECADVIMTKDRYRREYFASVIKDHFK